MAKIEPERVDFETIEAIRPPPSPDATEAERGLWYALAQVTALMRIEEEVALMRHDEESPPRAELWTGLRNYPRRTYDAQDSSKGKAESCTIEIPRAAA